MSIFDIEQAKKLRKEGKRLGRAGLSERVLHLVKEFQEKDGSYQGAMELAGRLHAISLASRFDGYWREQTHRGLFNETFDITTFEYRAQDKEGR